MEKKGKKKRFYARVEIYFVIYLATIINFFAVEGELKDYKDKQNKTILAIAKEKIEQLVSIDRIEPLYDRKSLTLNLKLGGFFDKKSLKGKISLKPIEPLKAPLKKEPLVYELYPASPDEEDLWFKVDIPKEDFGKNLSIPYEVTATISVKPRFTEKVREKWLEAYKDESVVNKLISVIDKVGKVELTKVFPNPVVPAGTGPISPFVIQVPRSVVTVLEGLEWEVPLFIGGVKEASEFNLRILEGTNLITSRKIGVPETKFGGVGTASGQVKIVATRLSDGEKAVATFYVKVRPPVWENPPAIKQVYLGDTYMFDGRLRDIPSEDIEVVVTGTAIDKEMIAGSNVMLGPFEKEGYVKFEVRVNGRPVKNMVHTIEVLKPPPPSVKLIDREPGTNNLIFQIITYGKTNGVKKFQQRGGIYRNQQLGEPEIRGNKKYYKWLVEIEKPYDETATFQEISFRVWDNFNQYTEHRKQYQYNY